MKSAQRYGWARFELGWGLGQLLVGPSDSEDGDAHVIALGRVSHTVPSHKQQFLR